MFPLLNHLKLDLSHMEAFNLFVSIVRMMKWKSFNTQTKNEEIQKSRNNKYLPNLWLTF